MSEGGTQEGRSAVGWKWRFKLVDLKDRQIRSSLRLRSDDEGRKAHKVTEPMLPRKASKRDYWVIVPQTDTGRQGEYPEALERTLVKELGKMTP